MKKRILAVVLALCMIAGCCTMYASALNSANVGDLIDMDTIGAATKKLESGKDFNLAVTVEKQSSPSMPKGQTVVTADNVDKLLKFTSGSKTLSFANDLSAYFTINSVTVTGDLEKGEGMVKGISFTRKGADVEAYKVSSTDIAATQTEAKQYLYADIKFTGVITGIKSADNFSSVTMGVRFFGSTYDNLVADEIAVVNAQVTRNFWTGTNQPLAPITTTSVTNKVSDLLIGDQVVLSTNLKDGSDAKYYKFSCWVDGDGKVLGYNPDSYVIKVDGSNKTVYAAYSEIVNRHTITYKSNGHGTVAVSRDGIVLQREIFDGDKTQQISVLEGKDVTFVITPDEEYEITNVYITKNGVKQDVASFKTILSGDILSNIRTMIKATGADRNMGDKSTVGSYEFKNVNGDYTIEVTFSKKVILEAPSGKDMPTVPAEGLTLETGLTRAESSDVAGENGENGLVTTLPAEGGVAGSGGAAVGGVVNPATGSGSAIAVFALMTAAAGAAFVTMKKKED